MTQMGTFGKKPQGNGAMDEGRIQHRGTDLVDISESGEGREKRYRPRQERIKDISESAFLLFCAAFFFLFFFSAQNVRADLVKTGANWVLNSDDPNPYKSTIGDGPGTPTGQPYTLTINPDATAFPTGNKPAISVNDGWTIDIYGTVQNHANSGNGLWNAGPNTIESHSNTLITVDKGGQILATGDASNGEAVDFIGVNNVIVNHGLVQSRAGAAIWFQETITSQSNSNTVDNYGTVRTLKGSNSSAIGNSGNNGVVFINRTGALVDGGLSFAGGSDQLTFEAGSKVTGAINGGDGTNDLTLQGAAGSNDSLAGAIQNFTTLTKDGQGTWTITGALSGFTKVSIEEGTLRLTGSNTGYNGSVIINSTGAHSDAVLEAKARSLPTTTTNVGNIRNDGVLRFVDSRSDDDGGFGSYAGQITGYGRVEMIGDGIVTLNPQAGANTHRGGTYVVNGTLNIASDAALGAAVGVIRLGGSTEGRQTTGTLQFGAGFNISPTRAIAVGGGGGVIDTNGFDTTIAQGIIGGALIKDGLGTLTLTGKNMYDEGTYVAGGTLQVGAGGTAGSIPYNGIISITGATAALAINHSDAVTISTRITGAGKFIQRGTGTTTLTGINTYSGGTDIENGTLAVSSNVNLGSGGPLTFGTATTNGTLRMNGNVDLSSRAISFNIGGGTIDTQGFRGSSSGVITGSGGLTKTGSGMLTLTGNSTYSGGTTISGGAIQLGNGGTSGSIVGDVANNGSLIFNRSDDVNSLALSGVISGSGNLIQRGSGTTTLSGGNSYTNGTIIENGTLAVNSDTALGATNGKIVLGDAAMATTGTLQFGSAFNLAGTRAIQLAGSGGVIDTHGFSSTISQGITGDPGSAFTKAGAGTLTLTGNNTYSGGTYITGGTLQVGAGGTAGSIPYNGIISITGATAALAINHEDAVTISTRITGAGKFIQRGTGTTTLTGTNTYAGGTGIENGTLAVSSNVNLGSDGPLTFGTTTTNGTLRMNGKVDLSGRAITLNAGGGTIDTQGFRGSSSGVITGPGGLTKTGSGMLTLTGNNTYTGGTIISGGAIQLGDGGTSGSIVGDVTNNGSLIFNRSDDLNNLTLAGAISGTGNLIQRGSGTTTLSGGNSYTNGTIIENGTLAVNADAALGAATGSLTFGTETSNGTLKLTANIGNLAKERNVTLQNGGGTIDTGGYHGTTGANIQGTGHFTKTGDGTLTLTADNDFTGGTTVTGGELVLGDGGTSGSVIGNVLVETTDSTVIYNRSDESTDPAGTVSGAGKVIQRGSGVTTITITNTNTYTGSTTLENGTLAISEDTNLGNGGAVIFDGGKLRLNEDLTDFNPNRAVTLKSSGTIDTLGNTGTIGSVIDGSGTLTKDGTGMLILAGENTYTGETTVTGGILQLGDGTSNAGNIVGNVTVNTGATFQFDRTGSKEYGGEISGAGQVVQKGVETTVLTGDSTYTGGTTIETGGTIQLGNGGTTGSILGDVANDGTLVFDRSNNLTFGGIVSGTGNLVQQGTGTTILTGTNTYTGGTLISDGALQLGNCGDSGSITGNVVDNGILIFSRSDDQTFSGIISGTGSVEKQCTNILTLDVENTYTGGTTLKQGDIVIAHENALGSTLDSGDLAGHVRYDAANDGNELIVYVDSSIRSLKNHFHVNTSSKITSKNVFQIDDDLTFSEITNKNTTDQKLGGAFYVGAGSKLAINVGRTGHDNIDLVFSDNKYGTTANDIYLDAYSILNLNISGDENNTSSGNAVFINSGIDSVGSGSLYIEGAVPGTGRQGLLQIAADSRAPETTVTGAVLRLVNGVTFSNSIYNQDFATILQGNGIVDVSGSALPGSITIAGTLSPDAATFTKGDDVVAMTKRFATLTLTGGKTEMKNFTFRYDVAGPSASHTNDLVKFGSQDVSIEGGKIDFITLSGTALNTGRYLVFDSDAANYTDKDGTALTDATLDTVLSGKVNGVAMTAGTPRIGYDFNFNNDPAQNQIWLDVNRNTLQVVWQRGSNLWTSGHWKSVQHRSSVYAENFNNGDLAIFENDKGNAIVTLGDNIIVSGLQLTKVSDSVVHITINGDYGISARKTDASIEGEYAKTDGSAAPNTQEFNTTGKLEIFGVYEDGNDTMTTLTLDNTGVNEFLEGIDIYGGRIVLDGKADRLGTYGNVTGYANAGLVTFKTPPAPDPAPDPPPAPETQKHVVEVKLAQTLQNRFLVEEDVRDAFIIANEDTTISGITGADGAIELQDGSTLTLQANGPADIILTDNQVDVKIGQAQLTVDGTGNTFVKSGIQGEISTTDTTASWLVKNGTGTLQIEADSHADHVSIWNGTLRIFDKKTLGKADTSLIYVAASYQGDATIAGAGTVQAKEIEVRGRISPDNLDAADATKGSRYGTLTLLATGSSLEIVMNGFTMDFDLTTPTQLDGSGKPTNDQDLLVVTGAVVGSTEWDKKFTGQIDFRTESGVFGRGDYLVIKSSDGYELDSRDIDGITQGGVLTATINGRNAAELSTSPRGTIKFELRDSGNHATGGDDKEVWITNSMNSLTMDWTGTGTTATPVDGNWNYTDGIVSSRQQITVSGTPTSERQFLDGDKMHISSADAMAVTLEYANGTAFLPTVSGLVVGRDSGNNIKDDNVTITGKGGITADKDSAFGAYVDIGGPDDLSPTGKLQKYGSGTLTVANTGGNRFLAGTELYNGKIVIGHEKALGAVDGTGTNLDGYVFFTGIDKVARTIEVADTVTSITNHFRAVSTAGANVFKVDNALTISGVANDNVSTSFGGAFYVDNDSNLTIDADADLTLSGNSANSVSNDIYTEGTLNFDVAAGKGVFVGSGLAGNGTVDVGGAGFVQVAADSPYEGITNVNSGSTLRVVSKSISDVYGSSVHTFNLNTGSNLEGNGRVYVKTAVINGNLSPDGMTKTSGTDTVSGDHRYAVLSIVGEGSWTPETTLDGFTFDYDAKAPNTGNGSNTPNDLLLISGIQTINLGTLDQPGTVGTVNFRTDTENKVTTLGTGKYLIVDTDFSGAGIPINMAWKGATSPDDVLAGKLNGTAFGQLSPRTWYSFRFNDTTEESSTANSQIWLDVATNSLTMDWTAASGSVWNTTNNLFDSLQTGGNGTTQEKVFRDGDFVHVSGNSDTMVELGTNVLVSGMVGGKNSAGTLGTGNVTLSGAYGILARLPAATGETDIIGKFIGDSLKPTGKLEKFGEGTLTLANTGTNEFQEGIDIYNGTITLVEADRLGKYGEDSTHPNAGQLTFKNNDSTFVTEDSTTKTLVVDTEQILQNRFLVEENVKGASITVNTPTEISGITNLDTMNSGGAIFVDEYAVLTINANADLTMKNNFLADGTTANDIALADDSTLKVNLADGTGIFVGSGIGGGTLEINGSGTNKSGFLQIAADSSTGVTTVQSGRLRLVGGAAFNHNFFSLGTGASLEGNGTVSSDDGLYIKGIVSPDSAVFTSGIGTVGDSKIGTLKFTDSPTSFDGFTFQYDVVAANGTDKNPDNTPNDLIQLDDQGASIHGGTVNFRTASGVGSLATGNYLVIDSNGAKFYDAGGNDLADTMLNTVLKGQVNGRAFETLGPRASYGFYFDNQDGITANSQIWLGAKRNTLTMVRTAGGVWNSSVQLWKSEQANGPAGNLVYDYLIERGDYARIYNPDSGSFEIDGNANQILSGLQLGETGDVGDLVIAGNFGITTETTDADGWIEGNYVGQSPAGTPVVPVDGMLKKYGANTATFTNTGGNLFQEGIELYAGTLSFNHADQLRVGGPAITGKVLAFKGDSTLRADATTELDTDAVVDNGVTGTLEIGSSISMLVNETISGSGTLKKTGDGTVQLNKSSTAFTGTASVDEGILRAVNNISFGSATSTLNVTRQGDDFGTIAGAGTFTGNTITVGGNISPDSFVDQLDGTQTGNKFGTLALKGNVLLDGFTMDYDLGTPNSTTPPSGNTPTGDLLQTSGSTALTSGHIDFRGTLNTGNYLIVDSDLAINIGTAELDGIAHATGILTASLNGSVLTNNTPRNELLFKFENGGKQIWLESEVNTLFMNWKAGSNDWGGAGSWTSTQTTLSGGEEGVFRNGDFVSFADASGSSTANLLSDVIVSGLDTNTNQTVLFTGTGGIHAAKDHASVVGHYAKIDGRADQGKQQFNTTGLFRKYGSGTTTFENSGPNLFEEGIELYGGILSYNNGGQLTVGSGKALTFKDNATLRADATAELNTDIVVENGKTGTFNAGSGISMLVNETISGSGTLKKTGDGTVQLNKSSTAFTGTASIEEGAFRLVAGKTFQAEHLNVLAGASLQGGGTVITTGNTTTVKGTISPDSSASVDVAEADKFGTLTIKGSTELDDFIFEYDLGTALPAASGSTPTGDLLKVVAGLGSVELRGGLIALHGTLDTGNYLIIDSDSVINIGTAVLDGFNDAAGILTASLNGNPLTNTTPRNELMFKFGNGGKQVWLESEVNTLFMNWKAGSKDWGGADSWTSTQTTLSGDRAAQFRDGDFVSFTDTSGSSTANLLSTVIVGGLDTNTDQAVLFTGTGGIHAKKSDPSMIGKFVKTDGSADPANQEFNTSGLFRKYGSGTTSFENTGGNLFEEGIELYQGTTGFNRADQLAVGNGKYLTFKGNAMLRPTASLGYDMNIGIDDNVTGTFDTAEGVVFDYSGTMTGSGSSQLTKTGGGTMNLNADSTGFEGAIDLAGGTLGINSNYGKSKSFVVHSGATLTGSGILGATASGGVIENGGTLAPRGYTAGNALATHLTVDGDLTFAAGSNFDVTISQNPNDIDAEGKMAPVSDYVKVQNGDVAIDSGANLNVTIDYWNGALTIGDFNEAQSGKFTVIDASAASGVNANEEFVLNLSELLPRGVKLAQGWQNYADGWLNFGAGSLYQLWFESDPTGGFADLCPRHNRNQIGQNLDQLTLAADPSMKDLIIQLSNPDLTRPELCNSLDYLTGDIVFNSLTLALKKPWRHPFGQLDRWGTGLLPCRDYGNCFACGEEDLCELEHKTRIWAEGFGRYTDVDSDGNALAFTIKRPGFAMGVDRKITEHTLLGATFNYSKPQLEQRTGKTEADDFEFGIYGRTELGCGFEAKAYAGFSLQRYDIKRRVFLSGKNRYADLHENYKNKTDGRALAASIDISRPIDMDCGWWLRPILALDYEQVWMDGYRERGGLAALKYDDSGMRRIALRAGLQPEYIGRENLSFVARIQYERELNPSTGDLGKVRFANAQIAGQRGASIRGVDWGDDCINLGIGMDWKFTDDRNISLQIDYDADFYDNAQTHSGMIGISWAW